MIQPHTPYRLIRDAEFGGLKAGEIVYRFSGYTYGCVDSSSGIAMSRIDGEYPFYEITYDNLELAEILTTESTQTQ